MDSPQNKDQARCQICGSSNLCAMANAPQIPASGGQIDCWCMQETFPESLKAQLQQPGRPEVCICRQCLHNYQEKHNEQ